VLEYCANLELHSATVKGSADPADLFVIWIGSNDFTAGLQSSNTIAAISLEITALSLAGAQQFLVISVPDISLTPDIIVKGTATVQAAKQFVTSVDTQLQNRIPLLASLLGVKIDLIDVNPLFTPVGQRPCLIWFQE